MIPKIDCCVEAVRRGVGRAHIIDGRIPHSILIELFSDEGHRHHAVLTTLDAHTERGMS